LDYKAGIPPPCLNHETFDAGGLGAKPIRMTARRLSMRNVCAAVALLVMPILLETLATIEQRVWRGIGCCENGCRPSAVVAAAGGSTTNQWIICHSDIKPRRDMTTRSIAAAETV
jgi:hypothetical protein